MTRGIKTIPQKTKICVRHGWTGKMGGKRREGGAGGGGEGGVSYLCFPFFERHGHERFLFRLVKGTPCNLAPGRRGRKGRKAGGQKGKGAFGGGGSAVSPPSKEPSARLHIRSPSSFSGLYSSPSTYLPRQGPHQHEEEEGPGQDDGLGYIDPSPALPPRLVHTQQVLAPHPQVGV